LLDPALLHHSGAARHSGDGCGSAGALSDLARALSQEFQIAPKICACNAAHLALCSGEWVDNLLFAVQDVLAWGNAGFHPHTLRNLRYALTVPAMWHRIREYPVRVGRVREPFAPR